MQMLCTLGPLFSRPTLFSFLLSSPKPGRTPEDLFCPSFSPPFGPYFPLSSYLRACRNGGVAIETGICKKEAMCRVCCIYRTHARKGGELDSTKKVQGSFLPFLRSVYATLYFRANYEKEGRVAASPPSFLGSFFS